VRVCVCVRVRVCVYQYKVRFVVNVLSTGSTGTLSEYR
jgi:hypothetical protein